MFFCSRGFQTAPRRGLPACSCLASLLRMGCTFKWLKKIKIVFCDVRVAWNSCFNVHGGSSAGTRRTSPSTRSGQIWGYPGAGGHCCEAENSPSWALKCLQIPALEKQKDALRRAKEGGRGVRWGDRLPSRKHIKNSSKHETAPTEQLLHDSRRPRTSKKAS